MSAQDFAAHLAIITRSQDGSGRVTGDFVCDEFLSDVATLVREAGGAS